MKFNTKEEVQKFTRNVRKEITVAVEANQKPSFTDTLEIVARLAGFKNYHAMSKSLEASTSTAQVKDPSPETAQSLTPKYPLVNEGQFDFTVRGETARVMSPHFEELTGTYERLYGEAEIASATRHAEGGGLTKEYNGSTEVFWNEQRTVKAPDGSDTWLDESGTEYPESQIILVPEHFIQEEAPVRQALVDAYVEFFRTSASSEIKADAQKAKRYTLGAGRIVGFSLTDQEAAAVIAAIDA